MARSATSPTSSANTVLAAISAAEPRKLLLISVDSVELELVLVVLLERRVLALLAQEAVAHRERLDLGAHEAAERVLGRADDRLAAHVEASVDDDRAASTVLKRRKQI